MLNNRLLRSGYKKDKIKLLVKSGLMGYQKLVDNVKENGGVTHHRDTNSNKMGRKLKKLVQKSGGK